MSTIEWFTLFSAISLSTVTCCGYPGSPAHAKLLTTDNTFTEGTVVTFECDPGYQLLGRSMLRCVNSEWDSPGLPFCVREIAFSKPSGTSSRSDTGNLAVDDQVLTCARFDPGPKHEWWVDLIETSSIDIVEVHYGMKLFNLTINIAVEDTRTNITTACIHQGNLYPRVMGAQYFKCSHPTQGRRLSITISADRWFTLRLCEVKVYSQSVLSPQDACGDDSGEKIESLKGQCYEVTPSETSFAEADKFCASKGGSLWAGDQAEFISWMMSVHSLNNVWYLGTGHNATDCTAFSLDHEIAEKNREITTCGDRRFGICVRPPRSCGTPPLPKHFSIREPIGKVSAGDVIGNFSCEEGFHLSGPVTFQCLNRGTFRRQLPTTCHRSDCGEPPKVANAFPVLAPKPRYYCVNESFVLYGSPDLKCDFHSSRWINPHIICVRLSADSKYGVKNFRDRLLQGVNLFPIATKVGLVLFIVTMVVLKILAAVAITNLFRYYRIVKPKLKGKHNSGVMLSSIHDELSRDACEGPAMSDQNRNNLTVDGNQELDLSTGDAQIVIRTTGSSTPKAPRTPNLRLNESSITENKNT